MWLAKRSWAQGGNSFEYSGDAPAKTVCAKSGEKFVVGACEYRSLPDCSPFGVYAKPPQGTEVLILSSPVGEVCLGAVQNENIQEDLQPGEILLCSAGGASIRLCNDGKILFNGKERKQEE